MSCMGVTWLSLVHLAAFVDGVELGKVSRFTKSQDHGGDVGWLSTDEHGAVHFGFGHAATSTTNQPAMQTKDDDVHWWKTAANGEVRFGFAHQGSGKPALVRSESHGTPAVVQLPQTAVAVVADDVSQDPFVTIKAASAAPAPAPSSTTTAFTTAAPPGGTSPHPLWAAFLLGFLCFALCAGNSFYRTKKNSEERAALAGAQAQEATPASGSSASDAATQDQQKQNDSDSDDETLDVEELSEDTYGMAIACVVRDMQHMASDRCSHRGIRTMRICSSLKLMFINMTIQIFLMVCIANFSCAKAVFDIRDGYSKFEKHMYNNHVYLTGHGNYRGTDDKYFNASLFNSLEPDVQGSACKIPFSQPSFLFIILLIWTFMVVGEIRQTVELFDRLIIKTATTDSMLHATEKHGESDEVIMKLTTSVKALFSITIVLPRLFIACLLLWLGCRWLSATTDFQNLVLNSVGLEFLLLTKELLYVSLVPSRTKRDTRRMKINVEHEASPPGPQAFLGTFLWGFLAVFWVYLYFCYQQVLPDYRWDVREVCAQWMEANYAGWS